MIFTINDRKYKADTSHQAALCYLNIHGTKGVEKVGGDFRLRVEYKKYSWTYTIKRIERWEAVTCETSCPREDVDRYGYQSGEITEDQS